jgi:hypothetical protein
VKIDDDGTDRFRLTVPSGKVYFLELSPRGQAALETGWVAPAYGTRVEATVLRRSLDAPPEKSEIRLFPGMNPSEQRQETP